MKRLVLLTGAIAIGCQPAADAPFNEDPTPEKPTPTPDPGPELPPVDEARPNIVIIYTDDMGVGDLSYLNSGWVKTPSIDRMASEGLIINSYYSAAPVSSPSRVGVTTGIFPLECGINTYLQSRAGNANCEQADFLAADAPSMARILKNSGYATAHFGKWHMGGGRDVDNAPQIPEYGFDEYSSTWESPDPDPKLTASNWIWCERDEVKRWQRTAYFVDKTLDFLTRHKDHQPCFVNLWPDDMHNPWVPDEESQSKDADWKSQGNFEDVLKEYDKQIGRFMDELDKRGLAENTIVIFTSDNGPAPSFKQIRANGMRGLKLSLHEGGIRMPFIIRWPAKIKPGLVDNTSVVGAVDLLPSLCKIARANLPLDYMGSGEDRSSVLLGTPSPRTKDLMWEYGRSNAFGAPGDATHRSPSLAIRRGDWKLLIHHDGTNIQLYNVANDPMESQELSAQNPKLVSEMASTVMTWWSRRPIVRK